MTHFQKIPKNKKGVRKQMHRLHRAFIRGDDISFADITHIGDRDYREKHHVIDRIVYGRFWRVKKLFKKPRYTKEQIMQHRFVLGKTWRIQLFIGRIFRCFMKER